MQSIVSTNIVPFLHRRASVRFAVRPEFTVPPGKPPSKPRLGSYCIKATCDIFSDGEEKGCPVSRAIVKGYDTTMKIAEDTENMCRSYLKSMPGGHWCGKAEVTILPNVDRIECSGQFYFEILDEKTKRFFKK